MPRDDALGEAIIDAYPLDDITAWRTEQLDELSLWACAEQGVDVGSPDSVDLPEHVGETIHAE